MRVGRLIFGIAALAFMAATSPVLAGFDRLVDENCSDKSNCQYWRPRVVPPRGWHRDDDASKLNLANVLVPDGSTYDNAKVVMYVRATKKTKLGYDVKSIATFMAKDREAATRNWPGTTFANAPAIKNGDGKALRTQIFTPRAGAKNRFERTAYGREGRFFLQFTLNATSQAGLRASMPAFEKLVAGYKAKQS